MTIYRADMLSAQQNFILRGNLQVSFEQEKERFGCKERKSFVNTEMLVFHQFIAYLSQQEKLNWISLDEDFLEKIL